MWYRLSNILRNFGKDTHSNQNSTPTTMVLYIRGEQLSPYSDYVTGWATEESWFDSGHEDEIFFLCSKASLPTVCPTQRPVQCILDANLLRHSGDHFSASSAGIKTAWRLTSIPSWTFNVWCLQAEIYLYTCSQKYVTIANRPEHLHV
jgi:hypothetical protein